MANSDIHKQTFREEAYELLTELETSLLELEESPDDMEVIGRVFRAMHTIKGSGSMFGFDDIAEFTHEVETVFDLVRNGKIPATRELVDVTLRARDHIKNMLDAESGSAEAPSEKTGMLIIEELKALVPKNAEEADAPPPTAAEGECGRPEGGETTYRIRFKPNRDIFTTGNNPIFLLEDLRQLGNCTVMAHTEGIPHLAELEPESSYTYWDIILTTEMSLDAVKDVFIFVEDDSEVSITEIDFDELDGADGADYKKLGEILIDRDDISPNVLASALGRQKRIGEMLVGSGAVARTKVEAALAEQKHVKEAKQAREASTSTASIRVASEKLDILVNLVGEMVTVQARLSQTSTESNDAGLASIAEEVERLTSELRDNTMSIRMVPIGSTFSRFRRLVRDLGSDLGKEIEMTTDGGETELDKTVIDKLSDPMVHLIRNSIGHGIEAPAERESAGKPAKGRLHLSAEHSGANVLIKIIDDGAGLDVEAIKAKGVERGIIAPDADLSDKDVYSLIMAPGFSMAREVTNVSGRGVGMDVVRRSIESLRGSIDIDSVHGKGTTITLKLPLTLAIIEGLLVKIAAEYFVLPLTAVEECVELSHADIADAHGKHIRKVRGEAIPYIMLRERFSLGGETPEIQQIVITETNGYRVGFTVDDVIGERQVVIKSLGRFYKNVEGISGATILGDGTVALILDIGQLYKGAEREETALSAR